VPWRRLAIGGALGAVAIGVALALAIPAINDSKDRASERERRQHEAFLNARHSQLVADQAAHTGSGKPARERTGRLALIGALEASIADDARERVQAGKLSGDIKGASCDAAPKSRIGGVAPEDDPGRSRGVYVCVAKTDDVPRPGYARPGAIGYPFQGAVDFDSGDYTWCKTNPPPGERVVPDPRLTVELPKACTQ
jgi:hypothetical protein